MKDFTWITEYNKNNNNEYINYTTSGKYLVIKMPEHPMARVDGYVYIHQLQAEKKLGRKLNKKECVHHIDENKFNNDIENLMVFKTKGDHTAFHNGSEIYLEGDVWAAKMSTYKQNNNRFDYCPICGSLKTYGANVCLECHKNIISKNIPSKEILEELIYIKPFTQIGKMFNVTDNAVRKWCKKYDLPYRKKDIELIKINN